MTVKRPHMVTRGYLQAWANNRNVLYLWDAESGRTGPQSINNATVHGHAYDTEHTTLDLEAEFGRIESDALPAIRSLAQGGQPNDDGRAAVVRFLDMHLERGRYADQTSVTTPFAKLDVFNGGVEMAEMGLGDRLALSRDIDKDAVRLSNFDLLRWRWRVGMSAEGLLLTGDGAVLLFERTKGTGVATITFPLSPTRLLVLGADLPPAPLRDLNAFTIAKSRRWLVDRADGVFARQMPQ